MRALLTVPSLHLDYGGPAISASRSAASLAALGVDVAIAFRRFGPEPEYLPSSPDVQLAPIPWRRSGTARAALGYLAHTRALGDLARRFRPDVIYDFGVWDPWNAASAMTARAQRIPWLCSPRGMLEPWPLSSRRWKKKFAWKVYQRSLLAGAAVLVATSADEASNLRDLLPKARIAIVPNGVDIPELPPGEPPPRKRQALYLSRLDPKKQPDLLIRLWSALRPPGWHLVVAGPGPDAYRRTLADLIASLGAESLISLRSAAYGQDKTNLLLGSQLFILPTYSENFGIAIAEALAHGLPVITTSETPWRMLSSYGAGWIAEPTELSVKAAMQTALSKTPGELADMGARGRQLAHEYSWDNTAARLLELARDVAQKGGTGSHLRSAC